MPWIRAIYRAETEDLARARLDDFEAEWGRRYPAIGQAWRRNCDYVVPFFAFPPAIRKMIYTTNAVESLHRSLRKVHSCPSSTELRALEGPPAENIKRHQAKSVPGPSKREGVSLRR
jgi:transposase-like protein